MKKVKKIFSVILGLFIITIVGLVGVILFAEYSGKRFSPNPVNPADTLLSEDDSRLAYDENGNLVEFPDGVPVLSEDGEEITDGSSPAPLTETPSVNDTIEKPYIMDLNTNLFHNKDCPDVLDISGDNRSEMNTTKEKIMNAGYEPCPNCNP